MLAVCCGRPRRYWTLLPVSAEVVVGGCADTTQTMGFRAVHIQQSTHSVPLRPMAEFIGLLRSVSCLDVTATGRNSNPWFPALFSVA